MCIWMYTIWSQGRVNKGSQQGVKMVNIPYPLTSQHTCFYSCTSLIPEGSFARFVGLLFYSYGLSDGVGKGEGVCGPRQSRGGVADHDSTCTRRMISTGSYKKTI